MPIILERKGGLPTTPAEALQYALAALQQIADYLKALVRLDYDSVREDRSLNAERALSFFGAIVTAAAVTRLSVINPDVINSAYVTALIQFDTGSGSGRFRIDGADPISAATAVAGMPIPAGGGTLTIVGAANIRSFAVIGEPAQTLNLSVTFFK